MKFKVAAIISCFLISSCGGSDSSSTPSESTSNNDQGREIEDTVSMAGYWISNCLNADENYYRIEMRVFDDHRVNAMWFRHLDPDCLDNEHSGLLFGGSFTIGDVVLTSSGVSANEIDLAYSIGGNRVTLYSIIEDRLYFGPSFFGLYQNYERDTELDFENYFVRE